MYSVTILLLVILEIPLVLFHCEYEGLTWRYDTGILTITLMM